VIAVHAVAQDGAIDMVLGQSLGQRGPAGAGVLRAVDAQASVHGVAHLGAGLGDAEQRVRCRRVGREGVAEVAGQPGGDLVPASAGIVAHPGARVALAIEPAAAAGMHQQPVLVVAGYGLGTGQVRRAHARVDRLPGFAGVVGAVATARAQGCIEPARRFRVRLDGVQREAALGRVPLRCSRVLGEARQRRPAPARVGADEQPRRLDAGEHGGRRIGRPGRQAPQRLQAFGALVRTMPGDFRERLPARAGIVGTIHMHAPHRMMGRRITRARIARIEPGALDLIAGDVRALERPRRAVFAARDEQALARADDQRNAAHQGSATAAGGCQSGARCSATTEV